MPARISRSGLSFLSATLLSERGEVRAVIGGAATKVGDVKAGNSASLTNYDGSTLWGYWRNSTIHDRNDLRDHGNDQPLRGGVLSRKLTISPLPVDALTEQNLASGAEEIPNPVFPINFEKTAKYYKAS
ncbi:MAG: hypothetical protein HQL35_14975 [Alphaproteobacteria bacterium]|nr:hypothetical protein [Alphaproteobacteria bacterium]